MKFNDLLNQHGVNVAPGGHHHTRDNWINFDCPFCGKGSGKFHMGYNTALGYVNCWRCGKKRLDDVVSMITGKRPEDARRIIAIIDRVRVKYEPHTGKLVLPAYIECLKPPHVRYLEERGFDAARLEVLWGIRGLDEKGGNLRWRIWIPIHYAHQVVSWTTRSIQHDHPHRYRSASADEEAMRHKELLYGEDYCRHACIVHEGPTDVWATGPGAVATCGVGHTAAQAARISRYLVRCICFDSEPAAQRRARKLCDDLAVFPGKTINVQLDANDPGSASRKELELLRTYLR